MNDTKKYLLSGAVVVSFALYTLHARLDQGENVVIAPKLALPTASPSPTPAPTAPDSTSVPAPTSPPPPPTAAPSASAYKNGQYTGDVADAYYGNVQVKAIISGGKITDVQFLDYPQDRRTSQEINSQAMPYLTSEAIQAQSAQVDIISGATQTSRAFIESLTSAIAQAKN